MFWTGLRIGLGPGLGSRSLHAAHRLRPRGLLTGSHLVWLHGVLLLQRPRPPSHTIGQRPGGVTSSRSVSKVIGQTQRAPGPLQQGKTGSGPGLKPGLDWD